MKPIFLFSLPRSGSTLLQRILMRHEKIGTTPEPWILIPFLQIFRNQGVVSDYSQKTLLQGTHEFIETLPHKRDDYFSAIRPATDELYKKHLSNNESYFLDKTPRYYLFIEEIAQLYPDAKFIFLFRDPLQILSSIIQTWGNGRLHKLFASEIDIYQGPQSLLNGYKKLQSSSFLVTYNDLISTPEKTLQDLMNYLELDWQTDLMDDGPLRSLDGFLGDAIGEKEYSNISKTPQEKWKKTFNTAIRQKLAKEYIKSIPDEFFDILELSKQKCLEALQSAEISNTKIIQDFFDLMYSKAARSYKLNIFFSKNYKWEKTHYLD